MNSILTIAALVAAVTVLVIVQAIVAHAKAKDAIKLSEVKVRAEEARKSAAEMVTKSQEAKAAVLMVIDEMPTIIEAEEGE